MTQVLSSASIGYTGQGSTILVEMTDIDGHGRARVRLADGQELVIPEAFFESLRQVTGMASGKLAQLARLAQLEAHDPLTRHDDLVRIQRDGTDVLHRADQVLDVAEGVPFLAWDRVNGVWGWALRLVGMKTANIGWAAWDDPVGQDNLVAMLDQPEEVAVLAGVVHPEGSARMASRQQVALLKAQRGSLPKIDLKKVREVLVAAQVTKDFSYNLVRNFAVKIGDTRAIVAAAVSPGNLDRNALPETDPALNRAENAKIRNDYEKRRQEQWIAQATQVITAQGWRIVPLPQPKYSYRPIIYFTRLPESTWETVAAAAVAETEFFAMNHGGQSF